MNGPQSPMSAGPPRKVWSGWRWHVAVFLIGVLIPAAYAYGVLSQRYELFPYHHIVWLLEGNAFDRLASSGGYDITVDRQGVPCRQVGPHALVLVAFGQSNSANSGEWRFGPAAGVYNFNLLDGRCYEASDPLLGAGGNGGSAWIPLAHEIVESGLAPRVVIASIGLGGTQIRDWTPGGKLWGRVTEVTESMSRAGLPVHAFLWHQGESDRGVDPAEYSAMFLSMVREMRASGMGAPIYIARATRCGDSDSPRLRSAQTELGVDYRELGIHAGPDTDTLSEPVWRTGCHFTRAGQLRHANMWFAVLAHELPTILNKTTTGK